MQIYHIVEAGHEIIAVELKRILSFVRSHDDPASIPVEMVMTSEDSQQVLS